MSERPGTILARTFQRTEERDFDFYLGKADAAIYNLNQAGWRVVRFADGRPVEEWTALGLHAPKEHTPGRRAT